MTVEKMIGGYTRREWLTYLGIATADDPKLSGIAALSFTGNALKVLRVNATENGWEFASATTYTDENAQDAVGGILTDTSTIDFTYNDGANTITADVKDAAITLAKQANVATATVFYRKTAGTGAPEVQTLATLKTDLGLSGTNTGDQTSVTGNAGTATALQTSRNIDGQPFNGSADITVIAPGTHAATSKATPVDADEVPLVDSAASNVLKKLTWANLKATLKTYLDTLYVSVAAVKSARVYNSAAISVPHATETVLTFNNERWDSDNIHSLSSNTGRLTATTAGLYQIGGTVSFAASGAGNQRAALIRLNGTTYIAIQGMPPVPGGSLSTTVTVMTQYSLAAGEYVELLAYQESGGGALNVNASPNYSPEFFMTRIGPQP